MSEVFGWNIQNICVWREAEGGQRVASAGVSVGRGTGGVEQLLYQRRILHGGFFPNDRSFSLNFVVQLRARHDTTAEILQVGQTGEVRRLPVVLRELV